MRNELLELRKQVENCRKCGLWETRKRSVFGEGPETAKVMLVGLGPGYYENLMGIPFVGAAGKLLDVLLTLAGLARNEVYITNVVKCYLPHNKATKEELMACTPYLDQQIAIIEPTIIIALGNVATEYLFDKCKLQTLSMYHLHGKLFDASSLFLHAKIVPMYHPAAALRTPRLKAVIMNDWKNLYCEK